MSHFWYLGDQEVKALRVKCHHFADGCMWIGALGSLDQHLRQCDYAHVPCPNGCVLNQQTVHVCNKDLENHLANECSRRQYVCLHCSESGVYVERTTVHLETCLKVTVQCPHPECGETIPRSELEQHKMECEYEIATCKFAPFGCTVTLAKKHMKAHEEDDNLHLQSTQDKVLALVQQINEQDKRYNAQLKRQTREIESIMQSMGTFKKITAPIFFEVQKFSECKRGDKILYSPSFYSSHDGYRFLLGVAPNGNGPGRGTHISIFAYLEKGDNDDSLTWPFRGTVIVDLINQLEDKNHLRFVINFPEDEAASGRVVGRERSSGWGKKRLIAHSQLGNIPGRNIQYLRNDILVFRIDVEVPGYKPWLECTI